MYGSVWIKIRVDVGNPKTADFDTVFKTVSKLFKDRCGACHSLPNPKSLGVNHIPPLIKTMGKRAALNEKQKEDIILYLQEVSYRSKVK